ncbi:MAG: HAD family hydrolase [Desulfobulbaceae bacterium]|nr:MAG: HAD family hydrolase [Desulfobulbaceae bacterium]
MSGSEKVNWFFDFDGVLVDSVSVKTEAFRTLFDPYGSEILAQVLEHHRLNGGISRIDKIQYAHTHFVGTPLSEIELANWGRKYSELVVDRVINAPWIKGAQEFLVEMQGCCRIFLISGTPETELKQVVEARGMTHYFDEILGSPIQKPAHIRALLSDYQLHSHSCVFVGDALTDYYAARETGLHFLGIQGDVELPEDARMLPDCNGLQRAVAELFTDSGLEMRGGSE